jgi:DNA modification methylase
MDVPSEISCVGNTWEIQTGSLDESYPVDLANLLIRMTDCLPGSVILEPFGGGTASLKAALDRGHSYFGFETDTKQFKKCEKVIEEFNKQVYSE